MTVPGRANRVLGWRSHSATHTKPTCGFVCWPRPTQLIMYSIWLDGVSFPRRRPTERWGGDLWVKPSSPRRKYILSTFRSPVSASVAHRHHHLPPSPVYSFRHMFDRGSGRWEPWKEEGRGKECNIRLSVRRSERRRGGQGYGNNMGHVAHMPEEGREVGRFDRDS